MGHADFRTAQSYFVTCHMRDLVIELRSLQTLALLEAGAEKNKILPCLLFKSRRTQSVYFKFFNADTVQNLICEIFQGRGGARNVQGHLVCSPEMA